MDTVKKILNQDLKDNIFMDIDTLRRLGMPADELAAEITNAIFSRQVLGISKDDKEFFYKGLRSDIAAVMLENELCPSCTHNHKKADHTLFDNLKGANVCRCGYNF